MNSRALMQIHPRAAIGLVGQVLALWSVLSVALAYVVQVQIIDPKWALITIGIGAMLVIMARLPLHIRER